jgi:hypothetical protein
MMATPVEDDARARGVGQIALEYINLPRDRARIGMRHEVIGVSQRQELLPIQGAQPVVKGLPAWASITWIGHAVYL